MRGSWFSLCLAACSAPSTLPAPQAEEPFEEAEAAAGEPDRPRRDPNRPKEGDGSWFLLHTVLHGSTPTTDKLGVPDGGREPRGGEAVATLDFDLDDRLDLVVVNGTDHFSVVRNWDYPEGSVFFEPKATLDGVPEDGLSNRAKGLGVHDLDGDGDLDLYLANQGQGGLITYKRDPPNDKGLFRSAAFSTWRNDGGVFTPLPLNIDAGGSKRLAVFEDFDLDGFVDAYVSSSSYWGIWYAGGTDPNKLYPGVPDGRFGPDLLDAAFDGPMHPFWVDAEGRSVKNFKAAIVRDLDQDGAPDLITGSIADLWANHELDLCDPAELGYQGTWERGLYVFHNRSRPGAIRFTDVTEAAFPGGHGTNGQGHVHSVVALDIDHDADLDLVVSGNRGRLSHDTEAHQSPILRVLRNDSAPGAPRLTDVTEEAGLGFLNRAADMPAPYPIQASLYGVDITLYPALMAAIPVDVNNDGHVDLVAVDRQTFSEDPSSGEVYGLGAWLFLGDGRGGFRFVPVEEHGVTGTARDVSAGDFDADGRVDLVFVDGSAGGQFTSNENRIWMNQIETDNHWVRLTVDEPRNRFGIGARVTIFDATTHQVIGYDEVRTDFNYRSKRDPSLLFGTGQARRVDVRVVFRDGAEATWFDQPVDQRIRVLREPIATLDGRYYLAGTPRFETFYVNRFLVQRDGVRVDMGPRRDLDGDVDADIPFMVGFEPRGALAAVGREGRLFFFDAWSPAPGPR